MKSLLDFLIALLVPFTTILSILFISAAFLLYCTIFFTISAILFIPLQIGKIITRLGFEEQQPRHRHSRNKRAEQSEHSRLTERRGREKSSNRRSLSEEQSRERPREPSRESLREYSQENLHHTQLQRIQRIQQLQAQLTRDINQLTQEQIDRVRTQRQPPQRQRTRGLLEQHLIQRTQRRLQQQ
ncbi:7512_t:CDS:1 [Paraglomus occultum]|uniref:7512_t:CDS:1 n=1 Tax=Paraglomus occultum TaxID=144539 RepID=A0A9N8ZIH3_9GLOM|nr:7512_t:CDS:1 [Paraglomus occultum]